MAFHSLPMPLLIAFLILSFEAFSFVWKEEFNGNWRERWVIPENKSGRPKGEWAVEPPKKCHNRDRAKGLKTKNDGGYFQISADIGETFNTYNKTFIFSYMIKNEQDIQVGGSYMKVLSSKINQSEFDGSASYYLMFGQDQDRANTDRVQLIIKKHGVECHHVDPLKIEKDNRFHMLAMIIFPDLSYEARVDDKVHRHGKLYDHFPKCFEGPTLPDQTAKKPKDWVDIPLIPDPKIKKPENWDQPMKIPDPDAVRPPNWDDAKQGEWKPPMIANKKYKGTWMGPLVKNPAYKGPWRPPRIPNPNWERARKDAAFKNVRYVGIEVFQPKAGSIFDNIFVGDDLSEYRKFVKLHWQPTKRYEDVYDPHEKEESFSLSGKDLFKKNKQNQEEEEEEDDDDDDDDDFDDL